MGCENPGSMQPGSEDMEVVLSACENPSSIQPVAYHMVNRRYSEFLNLQTRLEEKTDLRKLIKGKKHGSASRVYLSSRWKSVLLSDPLLWTEVPLVWLEESMHGLLYKMTWVCSWIHSLSLKDPVWSIIVQDFTIIWLFQVWKVQRKYFQTCHLETWIVTRSKPGKDFWRLSWRLADLYFNTLIKVQCNVLPLIS